MKNIFTCFLGCLLCTVAIAQTPNIKWSKYIGTTYWADEGECFYDGIKTIDNGFLLVGYDSGYQYQHANLWNKSGNGLAWITKVDSIGKVIWERKTGTYPYYSGGSATAYRSIEKTPDGAFVVAGCGVMYLQPFDRGEAHVMKINKAGTILWNKVFGGAGIDEAYTAKPTADGGYIVAGFSNSSDRDLPAGKGGADAWLLKLDASGNKQWSLSYGGTGNDTAYDVVQLPDNGYIVTGTSTSANGNLTGNKGSADAWVFKVNATGTLIWQHNLGGAAQDVLNKVVANDDGSINLSGYSYSNDGDVANNHGLADVWLVKLDGAGNVLWSKLYGGAADDAAFDLVKAPGGYFATGFTESEDGHVQSAQVSGANTWTIWFNDAGNLVWERSAGTAWNERSFALIPISNTDFLLAGVGKYSSDEYATDGLITRMGYANTIKGTLFLDANSNGIRDAGEVPFDHATITATKTNHSWAAIPYNGAFVISVDTGSYNVSITVDNAYYVVVPPTHSTNFTTYYNVDSFGVAIQPMPLKQDLSIHLLPLSIARPGFNASYKLYYKNVGTLPMNNGVIKLAIDGRTSLVSASPAASNIIGDTLYWNYGALPTFGSGAIDLVLKIDPPPTTNFGDSLLFTAQIDPVASDETPLDNVSKLREIVFGSYDPNDKNEANGGIITPGQVSNGEYLNYLIRFQNTGTDTAFTVVIRDTLDAQLDWSSLQMITASHPYQLTIEDGNKLSWQFDNILLADSFVNEPASHGYLRFRIKPKATVVVGDTIRNTAGIYFDYNLPVATNMVKTAVMSLATLPVLLSEFKAAAYGPEVQLTWKTASEYQTDRFEILRSTNGKDYVVLGKVPAQQAANGASYVFVDPRPYSGTNYYRLRIVDLNASAELSAVALVQYKDGGSLHTSIYPNPTTGTLNIELRGDQRDARALTVTDPAGRVVIRKTIPRQPVSVSVMRLSLAHLPKGLYTVSISSGKDRRLHQVVVK